MGAAAPRATIVRIGRPAGDRTQLDLELLAARRVRLIGTTFRGRAAEELHALADQLRTGLPGLPGLLTEHGVRAVLDSVFDLTTVEDAAERLTQPGLTGRIVLRIS